ncbi:hypothetical protein [Weissella paramesenteroides]|uniref:hypothetical protein n=1 Tax=Weissella paramesenteroides TaxID=1249 RepID=UPI00223B1549|nr:hypothetical protein [Weissella paramesenteroides]MCT0485951.1 hypothetical protein [Weissella paramesenteroides]
MTETNETSNQNELDLINLKYSMGIIDRLDVEISNSVDSLTIKDMEEITRYDKVARALEIITNLYPAMSKLLIDLQKQIDELPEYVEVAHNEL